MLTIIDTDIILRIKECFNRHLIITKSNKPYPYENELFCTDSKTSETLLIFF